MGGEAALRKQYFICAAKLYIHLFRIQWNFYLNQIKVHSSAASQFNPVYVCWEVIPTEHEHTMPCLALITMSAFIIFSFHSIYLYRYFKKDERFLVSNVSYRSQTIDAPT